MIPIAVRASGIRGGILEMDDPPEHREFRAVLNPYLSAHPPGPGLIDDVTFETVAVNLTGPLLCTRAVVPYMKERGYGKIANQSSSGAFMAARPTPTAARRSRCTNSRATPPGGQGQRSCRGGSEAAEHVGLVELRPDPEDADHAGAVGVFEVSPLTGIATGPGGVSSPSHGGVGGRGAGPSVAIAPDRVYLVVTLRHLLVFLFMQHCRLIRNNNLRG